MEIEFKNADLDRLEIDIKFDAGLGPDVVKAFRKEFNQYELLSMKETCGPYAATILKNSKAIDRISTRCASMINGG
jgi:hypothetical protein